MDIQILKYNKIQPESWKTMLDEIKTHEYPVVFVSPYERSETYLLEAGSLAAAGQLDRAIHIADRLKSLYKSQIMLFLEEHEHHKYNLIIESSFAKIEQLMARVNTFLKYAAKTGSLDGGLKDSVTTVGIQITVFLFAQSGLSQNMMTHYIDAGKLVKTDRNYGNALPNEGMIRQKTGSLETVLEDGFIPVIGYSYGTAPDDTPTRMTPENSDLAVRYIQETLQTM